MDPLTLGLLITNGVLLLSLAAKGGSVLTEFRQCQKDIRIMKQDAKDARNEYQAIHIKLVEIETLVIGIKEQLSKMD